MTASDNGERLVNGVGGLTRRRLLMGGVGAGVVVATGGAVYAASRATSPEQRAAEAGPPPPSIVTVPVKRGQLLDQFTLDGTFDRAVKTNVPAPAAVANAAKLIVTRLKTKVGDEVRAGDVLLEISGRPVMVLSGKFGAFRDLTHGDMGPDVEQLQQALHGLYGTGRTGVFDSRTAHDVARLYDSAGYTPVTIDSGAPAPSGSASPGSGSSSTAATSTQIVVPVGEIAFVPTLPAQVSKLPLKVGATATDTVAVLASGAWRVLAPLDDDASTAFSGKKTFTYVFGDGPLQDQRSNLLEIVPLPGQDAGNEALFSVSGSPHVRSSQAQEVLVTAAQSPKDSIVVPVSALWTADDGTVTVTRVRGGSSKSVPVTVVVSVLGEAAITGDVTDGDRVVVSDHG